MSTKPLVLVNGQPAQGLPADDRGFLFGDHVFETMLLNKHEIPLWEWHWRRLAESCQTLGIDLIDEDLMRSEINQFVSHEIQVLRATVTRGSSSSGYWIPDPIESRRIIQSRPWPDSIAHHRQAGVSVATSAYRLPSPSPYWPGIKHGNRLTQVMLAREAQQRRVDELMVFRDDGTLTEAIASNVLVVIGGIILSPSRPEVSGVGLNWLMAQGMNVAFGSVDEVMLKSASEVLLINAVAGIRPVRQWGDESWHPGPVCAELQSLWSKALP